MRKNSRQAKAVNWVFILPAVLVVGLLLLYPVLSSIYFSFTSKHLIKANYEFVWFIAIQ